MVEGLEERLRGVAGELERIVVERIDGVRILIDAVKAVIEELRDATYFFVEVAPSTDLATVTVSIRGLDLPEELSVDAELERGVAISIHRGSAELRALVPCPPFRLVELITVHMYGAVDATRSIPIDGVAEKLYVELWEKPCKIVIMLIHYALVDVLIDPIHRTTKSQYYARCAKRLLEDLEKKVGKERAWQILDTILDVAPGMARELLDNAQWIAQTTINATKRTLEAVDTIVKLYHFLP